MSLENIEINGIAAKRHQLKDRLYFKSIFAFYVDQPISKSCIHQLFYACNMQAFHKILFSPIGFALPTSINLKSPNGFLLNIF